LPGSHRQTPAGIGPIAVDDPAAAFADVDNLKAAVAGATIAAPAISYDRGSADPATSTIPWCGGQRTWMTLSASIPYTPLYVTALGTIQVSYASRVQ
jgi:hypothetical protein